MVRHTRKLYTSAELFQCSADIYKFPATKKLAIIRNFGRNYPRKYIIITKCMTTAYMTYGGGHIPQDNTRIIPPNINLCGFSPLLTTKPGNISPNIKIIIKCMTTLSAEQRFTADNRRGKRVRPTIIIIFLWSKSADLFCRQYNIPETGLGHLRRKFDGPVNFIWL